MALDEQSRYPVITSMTSGLFLKACFLFPTEAASNSLRKVRLGVRVGVEKGGEIGIGWEWDLDGVGVRVESGAGLGLWVWRTGGRGSMGLGVGFHSACF